MGRRQSARREGGDMVNEDQMRGRGRVMDGGREGRGRGRYGTCRVRGGVEGGKSRELLSTQHHRLYLAIPMCFWFSNKGLILR